MAIGSNFATSPCGLALGTMKATSSAPSRNSTDQTFTDWIMYLSTYVPNGLRYPLVGGTRKRHFAVANLKPRKLLENAQTPTTMAAAFACPGCSIPGLPGLGCTS